MYFLVSFVLIILLIYISIRLYLKSPQFGQHPKDESLDRVMNSQHFIKGKFRNTERIQQHMSLKNLPELMKQNFFGDFQKRPQQKIPVPVDALYSEKDPDSDKLKFTWFGHSAILLEVDNLRILIDPMLGPNASPVPGTVKRFSDLDIEWDRIGPVDLILYSHDHYDHLDYTSFKHLKDKTDFILTTLGVGAHLNYWGFPNDKIHECDWHESFSYKGLKFTSCPTKHFSGRTAGTRDISLWSAWVIETTNHKIFFSSDSGYFNGFQKVGEQHGPFDLCFMECGQYNHLWKENHMFPEESLQAFIDVNASVMVPIHWGAFSLAPHDWREPVERLLASAKTRSVEDILLPKPGQTVELGKDYPATKWWK